MPSFDDHHFCPSSFGLQKGEENVVKVVKVVVEKVLSSLRSSRALDRVDRRKRTPPFPSKVRVSYLAYFFFYFGVGTHPLFFVGFRVYKEKRKKKEEGKMVLQ